MTHSFFSYWCGQRDSTARCIHGMKVKKKDIKRYLLFNWCGQRDSNPYALRTQAPQACLSANSSTAAQKY